MDEYQSLVLRCDALNGKFSSIGNLESEIQKHPKLALFFPTQNQGMIRSVTPAGAQQLMGDMFVSCSCINIV